MGRSDETRCANEGPASRTGRPWLLSSDADLFEVVVANGEAGGPRWLKPDPDGYLSAAGRLGVAPERCLVLGDRADADGEAARRAGMTFRHVV